MGFSRACIYNWLAMYRGGRWRAQDARKRVGRPGMWKGHMIAWGYEAVVGTGPAGVQVSLGLVEPHVHLGFD